MELARNIIIRSQGGVVIPPTDDDIQQHVIKHQPSLDLLSDISKEQTRRGEPKFVLIEGERNTGKSILAELLTEVNKNTRLVSSENPNNDLIEKITLPPIISQGGHGSKTFIFDQPVDIAVESLQEYLAEIRKENGIAILFVRKRFDLPSIITGGMTHLTLTRDGLTRN
ncbi:MAG: hypothetical protein PSN44_05080 [Gammaproteobacteria bacterium]|nr:hypothetical protein [Gammaproteobacteria bacterium]